MTLSNQVWSSAEGEGVHLDTPVEELDLKRSIDDGLGLSNELIEALVFRPAIPVFVDVKSVRCRRRLPIEGDAESHFGHSSRRPHDEMQIPTLKAKRNLPTALVERNLAVANGPIAGEGPLVQA